MILVDSEFLLEVQLQQRDKEIAALLALLHKKGLGSHRLEPHSPLVGKR